MDCGSEEVTVILILFLLHSTSQSLPLSAPQSWKLIKSLTYRFSQAPNLGNTHTEIPPHNNLLLPWYLLLWQEKHLSWLKYDDDRSKSLERLFSQPLF